MNEEKAQAAAFKKYSGDCDTIRAESFKHYQQGWADALDWVKNGQEPVVFAREDHLKKLTRTLDPAGAGHCVLSAKKEQGCTFPLYTHPAPSEVVELVEILKGFDSLISESDGVAGFHLNGAIAEWGEFKEVHRLFSILEKLKEKQK